MFPQKRRGETEEFVVLDESTEEMMANEIPLSEDASNNDVEGKPTLALALGGVTGLSAPKSNVLDSGKAQIPTDGT